MHHPFWTILLFVFAAQSMFFLAVFLLRPLPDRRSNLLLLAMLGLILVTTVSNLFSATYLYRFMPGIAGFARGTVLLAGPLLYLYFCSVLRPWFQFKRVQLWHFLPYLIAFILIRVQRAGISDHEIMADINLLMEGKVPIAGITILWFVTYFLHLLIYIAVSRKVIQRSIQEDNTGYIIPLEQRINWLKKISWVFGVVALIFLLHTVNIIVTGAAGIITNYLYNLALASLVYLVGFQAIVDQKILSPGFTVKYHSLKVEEGVKDTLLPALLHLLEKDKVFTEPGLTLTMLAKRLDVHPNILSQIINQEFKKSYKELIHYYRIEEFKSRVQLPENAAFSIMGVAYEVGYNSKSAFNTAFKKQTGVTPSEYIKLKTG